MLSFQKKSYKNLCHIAEDNRQKNRLAIDNKLKEINDIDIQLSKVISDTKELTHLIQEKLSMRLKITPKTIKTIVTNIREGIIILNSVGDIIEINDYFIKKYSFKSNMNFKDICKDLKCTHDDKPFKLLIDFEDMSKKIFNMKNESNIIQDEILITIDKIDNLPFDCLFSMKVLDNDPIDKKDVCYIMFFKPEYRKTPRI